jgi:hypothetical protein
VGWAVSAKATVQADLRSVAAWWTHPDRTEEANASLHNRRYSDISIEVSYTDVARVRDIRFKTSTGSFQHGQLECDLGPDGGIGTWNGDRFVLVSRGFTHKRSAAGVLLGSSQWDQTTTFVATIEGATEIVGTHNGRLMEGGWFQRFLFSVLPQRRFKRQLRDQARRCEQALRSP